MTKKWFVAISGKNEGPFTSAELSDLFMKGDIDAYTLVWRKGLSKWQPFLSLKKEIESTSSPAPAVVPPPVPVPAQEPELPEIPHSEIYEVEDEVEARAEVEVEAKIEIEEETLEPEAQNLKTPSIVGGVLFFVTVMFTFLTIYLFSYGASKELTFRNLSLNVLNNISKKYTDSKFYVNFGIDKNLETVFAKSNLNKDAVYEVLFTALTRDEENQIQSIFYSKAQSIDGKLKFDEFDFIVGQEILQGEYEIKVEARLSNTFDLLLNHIFGRPYEFFFKDKTFLVKDSVEKFQEEIKKIQLNRIIKEKENFEELLEKINTLKSILSSISLNYFQTLEYKFGRYAAKQFAAKYASGAGSILQNIIVTDYKNAFKISKERVKLQGLSEEILSQSKEISSLSADLIKSLEANRRLNNKLRASLKTELESKKEQVVSELDALSQKIKKEIESLN